MIETPTIPGPLGYSWDLCPCCGKCGRLDEAIEEDESDEIVLRCDCGAIGRGRRDSVGKVPIRWAQPGNDLPVSFGDVSVTFGQEHGSYFLRLSGRLDVILGELRPETAQKVRACFGLGSDDSGAAPGGIGQGE